MAYTTRDYSVEGFFVVSDRELRRLNETAEYILNSCASVVESELREDDEKFVRNALKRDQVKLRRYNEEHIAGRLEERIKAFKPTWSVELADGRHRKSLSLDEVLHQTNGRVSRITSARLGVGGRVSNGGVQMLVTLSSGKYFGKAAVSIEGSDELVAVVHQNIEQFLDAIKLTSPSVLKKSYAFFVPWWSILALSGYMVLSHFKSAVGQQQAMSMLLVAMLAMIPALLLNESTLWVWRKLYAPLEFELGEGTNRVLALKQTRQNIGYSVVGASLLSIAAGLFFMWLD